MIFCHFTHCQNAITLSYIRERDLGRFCQGGLTRGQTQIVGGVAKNYANERTCVGLDANLLGRSIDRFDLSDYPVRGDCSIASLGRGRWLRVLGINSLAVGYSNKQKSSHQKERSHYSSPVTVLRT